MYRVLEAIVFSLCHVTLYILLLLLPLLSLEVELALRSLQSTYPQDEAWSNLAMQGLQSQAMTLSLTEAQPRQHSNATTFKCHQRSQIIQDTVELSCLVISNQIIRPDQDSNSDQTGNPLKYSTHCATKPQGQAPQKPHKSLIFLQNL